MTVSDNSGANTGKRFVFRPKNSSLKTYFLEKTLQATVQARLAAPLKSKLAITRTGKLRNGRSHFLTPENDNKSSFFISLSPTKKPLYPKINRKKIQMTDLCLQREILNKLKHCPSTGYIYAFCGKTFISPGKSGACHILKFKNSRR